MALRTAAPLLATLLAGCIAEFPDPPQQFADADVPDAVQDAQPDLALVDVPVADAMTGCGVPEVCNGLDDDCDGRMDESVPLRSCPLQLGVCKGSRQPCLDGVYQPCTYTDTDQPYVPQEAPLGGSCDGVDNDCDGAIDEGCTCEPGDIRRCGSTEGVCTMGNQLCEEGVFGRCVGGREPTIEQGNGVDDDCDGRIDEGSPPAEIVMDLADLSVGGLGERPGLPGQVATGRGLPLLEAGVLVERTAPLVTAVFIPTPGPCLVAEEVSFDFTGQVAGVDSAGVHGKGPAGLIPHPADALGLVFYHDTSQHSFLEMPANYGISFDLWTMRNRLGRSANRFRARLGTVGPGPVTFYVLVDGMQLVSQTVVGARELDGLDVGLPDLARVLTLVTTNAGQPGTRAAWFGDPEVQFPPFQVP